MQESSPCCTQFWLRKLHSLTGFIFLGYFLCLHVRGEGAYETTFYRAFFLFLPLIFHGLYGLFITYESSPNNFKYGYVRNWMYLAQRVTALIIVPFIIIHVGAEVYGWPVGSADWYPILWHIGLAAAVFHMANGLFGTVIDWGLSVGPHSQKVFVFISFAAFIVLYSYGVYTLTDGGYY